MSVAPDKVAGMARIAVIGAGMGAMAAAARLAVAGHRVAVYERGRRTAAPWGAASGRASPSTRARGCCTCRPSTGTCSSRPARSRWSGASSSSRSTRRAATSSPTARPSRCPTPRAQGCCARWTRRSARGRASAGASWSTGRGTPGRRRGGRCWRSRCARTPPPGRRWGATRTRRCAGGACSGAGARSRSRPSRRGS
ncbi:NAD(P)-binding protein [Streptomyces stramineus]